MRLLATAELTVRLRPVTPDDRELLLDVFASTRTRELALLPAENGVRSQFLAQQFAGREAHRRRVHPSCAESMIVVDGESVGWLCVDHGPRTIELVEIALVPQARGRGIGTTLLAGLVRRAARERKPLSLQVEATNPARALYERLGFRCAADHGAYLRMECLPENDDQPPTRAG